MKSNILRKGWSALMAVALGVTALAGAIVAAPTAEAASVSLSNRANWLEYDHYHATTASKYASKNHPSFTYNETMADNSSNGWKGLGVFDDFSEIKAKMLTTPAYGSQLAVAHFGRHIYYDKVGAKESLNFLGYGASPNVDFTIYPEEYEKMKSVSFEIDASKAYPHTLNGFGVMFNIGSTNESAIGTDGKGRILDGNMLYFDRTGSGLTFNVYVIPLKDIAADGWHSRSTAYSVPSGTSAINASSFTLVSGDMLYLSMDINKTSVKVTVTKQASDGTRTTLINGVTANVPNVTEYAGLGPVVTHNGHGCPELTYVQFGNLVISRGYTVTFHKNDGSDQVHKSISEIEENNSGMGEKFPKSDILTRNDYAFLGWSTDPDATTPDFNENTPITGNTDVYAVWVPVGVTVDYPNTSWQADKTTFDVIVTSGGEIKTATIKWDNGDPDTTVNLALDPATNTYKGTVTVDKNKTGTVTAVIPTGGTNTSTKTAGVDVTWVDTLNPDITNIPNVSAAGNVLEATDLTNSSTGVKFSDPAEVHNDGVDVSSGVKESSKTLILYKVNTDGSLSTPVEIPWSDVPSDWATITPGRYFYDIKVTDEVGHETYASSTYKSSTTNEGTGKGQPDENGNPGDLIGGGGGSETSVIINAGDPTITLTHPNDGATNPWYTTPSVDVDYTANGGSGTKTNTEITSVTVAGGDQDVNISKPGTTTESGKVTVTGDGEHKITGSVTNVGDLTKEAETTVLIDTTYPKLTITPDGSGDLSKVTIVGDDSNPGVNKVSEIDDSSYKVTVVNTGTNTPETYDSSTDGTFENWVNTLPTGEYQIVEAEVSDNATNTTTTRGDSTTFWVDKGDAVMSVSAGKTPQPNSYNDGSQDYTNTAVNVTDVVITSKLPLTSVTVAGQNIAVTPVTKVNDTYTYTFPTTNYSATANSSVGVQVVAETANSSNSATVTFNEIDKLAPIVTQWPDNTTGIKDMTNSDFDYIDDSTTVDAYNSVVSGYKTGSDMYMLESTFDGKTSWHPTIQAALAEANSRGLADGYYIHVKITDNVTNPASADGAGASNVAISSGGGSATVSYDPTENSYRSTTTYTKDGPSTGPVVPGGLDPNAPKPVVSITGASVSENAVTASRNSNFTITATPAPVFTRIIVFDSTGTELLDATGTGGTGGGVTIAMSLNSGRGAIKTDTAAVSFSIGGTYTLYVVNGAGGYATYNVTVN